MLPFAAVRGRWQHGTHHIPRAETVRREVLHLPDCRAALFFEKPIPSPYMSRKRTGTSAPGIWRYSLYDCLADLSPNSPARSSSSAILAHFFSGVCRGALQQLSPPSLLLPLTCSSPCWVPSSSARSARLRATKLDATLLWRDPPTVPKCTILHAALVRALSFRNSRVKALLQT